MSRHLGGDAYKDRPESGPQHETVHPALPCHEGLSLGGHPWAVGSVGLCVGVWYRLALLWTRGPGREEGGFHLLV